MSRLGLAVEVRMREAKLRCLGARGELGAVELRRVGASALVVLGAVMMFFCESLAVFRLVPAYEEMMRTGDGTAFRLGLLIVVWWAVPALIGLAAGGVLLHCTGGSLPAIRGRFLAVLSWLGAALSLAWVLPWVSGLLRGAWGIASGLGVCVLLVALGLLLGWAGVMLWWGV